jgi:hypothetical protein
LHIALACHPGKLRAIPTGRSLRAAMQASCKQTPRGCWPYSSTMTDRSRFTIAPIGSLHTGWALKVDGIIRRSSSSLIPLGAYVDAIMAGADEADADNIGRAIEARPWPKSGWRSSRRPARGVRRAIRSRSPELLAFRIDTATTTDAEFVEILTDIYRAMKAMEASPCADSRPRPSAY